MESGECERLSQCLSECQPSACIAMNACKDSKRPLADVVGALRRIILSTDREIGEEVKWNAPTFFCTGEMKPFSPKEYKRYVVVFNLYRKDCLRLVFPSGARVSDNYGFLEGDYADGRRLALFFQYGRREI
jgi:hypothetical protein